MVSTAELLDCHGARLTHAAGAACRIPNDLVEVAAAQSKIVLAIVERSVVFSLQKFRMLLIVGLVKLVLGRDTMSM